jgi:phosphatidylglycerophosphate synthase
MRPDGSLLTAANGLTVARLALAGALVACVLGGAPLAAALVLALAVASDVADGRLARRRAEASPLGGLLDHGVDAAFVSAGSAALAAEGALPLALPPMIAAAFAQYALDSHGAPGGLRGSRLGRWNGIAYYVAVATPLVRDALSLGWPGPALVLGMGWLLVGSTALSMLDRALWGRLR